MKIKYLIVFIAILLVVGCGAKTPETPPVTSEIPAEAPEQPAEIIEPEPEPEAAEEETTEPEPEETSTAEIEIRVNGFNPSELTVKAGATVTLRAKQARYLLTISGTKSGAIASNLEIKKDETKDITLDTAETVKIFNVFTKKVIYITVEE